MNQATDPRSGMTTIELIVSLSLLGLVLLIAAGSLRFGGAVWHRGEELHRTISGLYDLDTALRTRLAAAMAFPESRTPGAKRVLFDGKKESVRFVAPAPQSDRHGGYYIHDLFVDRSGARSRIVLRSHLFDPGRPDQVFPDTEHTSVLAEGVESMTLSYFERRDERRWYDEWREREHLPSLVRIEVKKQNASATAVPIVIATKRGAI